MRFPSKRSWESTDHGELSRYTPTRFPTMLLACTSTSSASLSPSPNPEGPRLRASTFPVRRIFRLYIRYAPTELPSSRLASRTAPSAYMKCSP